MQMGDKGSQRVGKAFMTLIEVLVSPTYDEDNASLDERRDDAKALATSIIDRLVSWWKWPLQCRLTWQQLPQTVGRT